MTPLVHQSTGRTLRAGLILLATWSVVLCLWLWIALSPWIAALMLATTLPAAWDFVIARRAWLRLDDGVLDWGSGRARGTVALDRIETVRFETRLDLSPRVRLVLRDGRRLTLPQDALPPGGILQTALEARGVHTERHPFAGF
ncbi:hypothetical protein [Thetidibacter halocola]|uniref:Uncharacterized protein n=1 Tax=Thetidibacter halocola TaxID=2827239 RepID=A0A8J7WD37_9RHOB|nr:hypothetical protein [Thetidibacter halocola]MBS0123161.1 hypothetical protein [Thetidibacter halocola]